ncbi:MAG: AMP-binding protein, partial [Kiloniellales bacterium]
MNPHETRSMDGSQTLQSVVQGLAAHGDRPAILAVGPEACRTWSYAELTDAAMRLAQGLMEFGVAPGEPVALLAANRPEWIVVRLALIAAGALAVPVDDLITDADLQRVVSDSGCRRVFT